MQIQQCFNEPYADLTTTTATLNLLLGCFFQHNE